MRSRITCPPDFSRLISVYIALISGIFNALIGAYILSLNPKKIVNKVFFLITVGFVLFDIGEFFVRISTIPEDALFWGKINYSTLWIAVSFSLIFVIHFPRKTIPKKYNLILKYIEALVVIIGFIVYLIFINQLSLQNVLYTEWGYRVTLTSSSIFILIWLVIITILSFIVLFHKYFYGELYRHEKKQIKIFSLSIVLVPLAAIFTNLVPPLINIKMFPMTSLFILIFSFSVAYAIKKYQFLFPSSELIAENILDTMNESVIVVDKNDKIGNLRTDYQHEPRTVRPQAFAATPDLVLKLYSMFKHSHPGTKEVTATREFLEREIAEGKIPLHPL